MTGQSLNYSQLNFLYNLFVIILLAAELNFTPTARCFRGLAVIFTQKRSHVFHAAYRATNSQNYRAFSKKAQKAVYFTQHIGRQTSKITGYYLSQNTKIGCTPNLVRQPLYFLCFLKHILHFSLQHLLPFYLASNSFYCILPITFPLRYFHPLILILSIVLSLRSHSNRILTLLQ